MPKNKLELDISKKQADRLDIYVNHVLLGDELSKTKLDYLEKMKFAFTSLLNNSRHTVACMLNDKYGLSKAQPYNIINDAISLFGDIDKANKEGIRYMQGQRLMQLYENAIEKQNIDAALQILKEYNKINQLYQSKEDESNINNFIESLNMTVVFSTDTKELEETEDIDYEEA